MRQAAAGYRVPMQAAATNRQLKRHPRRRGRAETKQQIQVTVDRLEFTTGFVVYSVHVLG